MSMYFLVQKNIPRLLTRDIFCHYFTATACTGFSVLTFTCSVLLLSQAVTATQMTSAAAIPIDLIFSFINYPFPRGRYSFQLCKNICKIYTMYIYCVTFPNIPSR